MLFKSKKKKLIQEDWISYEKHIQIIKKETTAIESKVHNKETE
jgi:hypothetical protein